MKTKIKYIIFPAIICFLMNACLIDETETVEPAEEKVPVGIRLEIPEEASVQTYGLDVYNENYIKEIDILVFNSSNVFLERIKISSDSIVDLLSNGSEKLVTVNLARTGSVKLAVVANARTIIDNATISNYTDLQGIRFSIPASGWKAQNGANFSPLPMTGTTALITLGPTTNISPIRMKRSLAKIDVGLNYLSDVPQGLSSFKLKKIHLYNINDNPYLFSGTTLTNYGTAGPVTYTATGDKEITREIYLAEAMKGSDSYRSNSFCIIIEGIYGTDTESSFYRLDFMKSTAGVNNYFGIDRNYRYKVNIQSVQRSGYKSAALALASHSINEYVDYLIIFTDVRSTSSDGVYYMNTSPDIFKFTSYQAMPDNIINIFTNDPYGWDATTDASWIAFSSPTHGAGNTNAALYFKIMATTESREAKIIIHTSQIYKEIIVRQAYCDKLPANYNNMGNAALQVYLYDLPKNRFWYEYANVLNRLDNMDEPPFPLSAQCNPARQYSCAALTIGGYTDWRLPTYNELSAMAQYAIDNGGKKVLDYITNMRYNGSLWSFAAYTSSSSSGWNSFKAIRISSSDGGVTYTWGSDMTYHPKGILDNTANLSVKCVRTDN